MRLHAAIVLAGLANLVLETGLQNVIIESAAAETANPSPAGNEKFRRAIARKIYSESLQAKFLQQKQNYFVSVSGSDLQVLEIVADDMDWSQAEMLRRNPSNTRDWSKLEFYEIRIANGQGQSWTKRIGHD